MFIADEILQIIIYDYVCCPWWISATCWGVPSTLRLFDKMCSDVEWKLNDCECGWVLKIFKTATQVLSGSKYPTISLVLLFRVEIVAALQDLPTDCAMVMSIKQRMWPALRSLTALNIIGALLDPFHRKLTVVQDLFVAKDTTAFHLLSQLAMDTYTYVQQLQANNNLSGMNEAASTCEFAHAVWFHGKKQTRPAAKTCPFYRHRC